MGQEIIEIIRDGDVLLMNEAGVAIVNGVLETKNVRLIFINMQPYAPTTEFSGENNRFIDLRVLHDQVAIDDSDPLGIFF